MCNDVQGKSAVNLNLTDEMKLNVKVGVSVLKVNWSILNSIALLFGTD